MSKWVSVTKNSTTLGTSEVNIISPFELSPLTDDVIIQIMETSGNAATIRVYGSIGNATSTESVPEFPTGGNNWGGINTDAEGSLNADGTLVLFNPRKIRYLTVRGLRNGSVNATVNCIVSWRSP